MLSQVFTQPQTALPRTMSSMMDHLLSRRCLTYLRVQQNPLSYVKPAFGVRGFCLASTLGPTQTSRASTCSLPKSHNYRPQVSPRTFPRDSLCRQYSVLPDSVLRSPGRWSKWITKLILHWEGKPPYVGSGFFVNIPGAKKDIIFTAGHNFINDEGQFVQSVDVYSEGELIFTARELNKDYYVTDSYRETPNNTNPINDYGCILVDRGPAGAREGFGISMALGNKPLRQMGLSAFVGGYPVNYNDPNNPKQSDFRYSMGSFGQTSAEQLHYLATTEKGQSGGPVWVLYKGFETAVGIHNHDQREDGTGNRATRLNVRTLYDLYRWGNIDAAYGKSITSKQANTQNLFLKIDYRSKCARARRGTDGLSTTFDVIPAHTAPTDAVYQPRYAIVSKPKPDDDQSWLWLKFNSDPNAGPKQVTAATGGPSEDGMVRLHGIKSTQELQDTVVQIEATDLSRVIRSSNEPSYVLRMEGKGVPIDISDLDEDSEPESSDVKLVDLAKTGKAHTRFGFV